MCNCGSMLDYYNRALMKSIDSSDTPHVVKIFGQYELPVGKGKALAASMPRILNGIVGNWVVSYIGVYSSGTPIGFTGAVGITGWNGGTNRLNVAPGQLELGTFEGSKFDYANRNLVGYNKFFDTSLVTAPAAGTFGTGATRFAQIRNFAAYNEDMGLQKDFKFREKYRGQIRAQFLNALNRHTMSAFRQISRIRSSARSLETRPGTGRLKSGRASTFNDNGDNHYTLDRARERRFGAESSRKGKPGPDVLERRGQ
jgi:hypothetical protein